MGSKISRRLVYVKMKRKPLPKLKLVVPSRDSEKPAGQGAGGSPSAGANSRLAPPSWRRNRWLVAACGVGVLFVLLAIAGMFFLSAGDATVPDSAAETPDARNSRVSSAQAFLNAPFQRRHR